MTSKIFLIRFVTFLLALGGGWATYLMMFHLLVAAGTMPDSLNGQAFGRALTYQTAFVFMGSAVVSFLSIFIMPRWRLALLLAPVYAMIVFPIAFTVMHRAPPAVTDGQTPPPPLDP